MRIVIKIGTSTLAYPTGHLNIRHIEKFCKVVSDIKNAGCEVIVVSSGAVGMGMGKLSLAERPKEVAFKQAVAAVGQCELMYTYSRLFGEYNHTVAQILLTAGNMKDKEQHDNFKNTVNQLLALGVIPIINENDSVAVNELVIGDNDTLAAIVSRSVNADTLVIFSDVEGLSTTNPHKDKNAKIIPEVAEITPEIEALAGGTHSKVGTGGMITKIDAAKIATESGTDMIITNGDRPENLYDIIDGKQVGTKFLAIKKSEEK
ncbi:MAG: glutamate 5-kinase [Clostridiales bacterium]|nr:glutamate 5-kinase [Candidatus Equinaster intestinalis]